GTREQTDTSSALRTPEHGCRGRSGPATATCPGPWDVRTTRRPAGRRAGRMTTDKIYLVGFMAAGKSTVGRRLAGRLGWRAEDIDDLIEQRERLTVADIFARHGEPYFRRIEREMLRLIQPMRHVVVATGGGTFVDPENRALINLDGVSVWLDLPFSEVLARMPVDGRRPLAAARTT